MASPSGGLPPLSTNSHLLPMDSVTFVKPEKNYSFANGLLQTPHGTFRVKLFNERQAQEINPEQEKAIEDLAQQIFNSFEPHTNLKSANKITATYQTIEAQSETDKQPMTIQTTEKMKKTFESIFKGDSGNNIEAAKPQREEEENFHDVDPNRLEEISTNADQVDELSLESEEIDFSSKEKEIRERINFLEQRITETKDQTKIDTLKSGIFICRLLLIKTLSQHINAFKEEASKDFNKDIRDLLPLRYEREKFYLQNIKLLKDRDSELAQIRKVIESQTKWIKKLDSENFAGKPSSEKIAKTKQNLSHLKYKLISKIETQIFLLNEDDDKKHSTAIKSLQEELKELNDDLLFEADDFDSLFDARIDTTQDKTFAEIFGNDNEPEELRQDIEIQKEAWKKRDFERELNELNDANGVKELDKLDQQLSELLDMETEKTDFERELLNMETDDIFNKLLGGKSLDNLSETEKNSIEDRFAELMGDYTKVEEKIQQNLKELQNIRDGIGKIVNTYKGSYNWDSRNQLVGLKTKYKEQYEETTDEINNYIKLLQEEPTKRINKEKIEELRKKEAAIKKELANIEAIKASFTL